MKNPFSYLFRARDKPQNAVSAAPSFYFGMSGSGKSVSPSSAIQVSAVYACVRVIAETIASLPFHVYEATDEGSRKAVEHPLYRLIHDEPNSGDDLVYLAGNHADASAALWEQLLPDHPHRPLANRQPVSAAAGSHGGGQGQQG